MIRLLLILVALVGCHKKTSGDQLTAVKLKTKLMEEWAKETSDHHYGWPDEDDCDGALWAGVARAAGIRTVDISAAVQQNGRPTRLPNADCGIERSGATTSTDMRMGTILGLVAAKDNVSLESMRNYAKANHMLMGEPKSNLPAVWLKPNERFFLSQAIDYLVKGCDAWCDVPPTYAVPMTDSDVHLTLLAVQLEEHMGVANEFAILAALEACRKHPDDALALAVCGDRAGAEAKLVDPAWAPPSYVRGAHPKAYELAYQLFTLNIIMGGF